FLHCAPYPRHQNRHSHITPHRGGSPGRSSTPALKPPVSDWRPVLTAKPPSVVGPTFTSPSEMESRGMISGSASPSIRRLTGLSCSRAAIAARRLLYGPVPPPLRSGTTRSDRRQSAPTPPVPRPPSAP